MQNRLAGRWRKNWHSDIDLEHRVLHLERGVKEVWRRDGLQAEPGRDVKVGKLKSATSKRTIPLNDTATAMIQDLRKESYFGENTPLVPDEHGDYTRPVNFRKRYYRILAAAGIEKKGLHSLRHTLVPDEHGNFTRSVNFRKRYYRILAAASIEKKGLHSLRHTFASSLVNGIKQEDGTIKSLTPRQVADSAGPQHKPNYRVVLRQKGHLSSTWYHRWLQLCEPLCGRMHKNKAGKFCARKTSKKSEDAPGKARKRRNWVRFRCWRGVQPVRTGGETRNPNQNAPDSNATHEKRKPAKTQCFRRFFGRGRRT